MDRKAVLLATIESALTLESAAGSLSAQTVNGLGRQLGLSDRDTFEFVRQLSGEGAIDLEWGGSVRSVPRQKERPSIHLEKGATYVGEGASIHNAAVGAGARVQIATGSDQNLIPVVARLTVAIEKLTAESVAAEAEHRQALQQLIGLTQSMQQQLLKGEKPDKSALAKKLDEAEKGLGLLEKAGTMGAAVAAHSPQLWHALHEAYGALTSYLGGH